MTGERPGPAPVSVRGGTGGITARCEDIAGVAGRFGAAAQETLGAAWTLHGYLVHPALASSALLDPGGYAVFETDLLTALDGAHGLSWAGLRCGALDGELRVAAAAYHAADTLAGHLHDEVAGLLGAPAAIGAAGGALGGGVGPAAQAAIAADPAAADTIIDALNVPGAIAAAALALPDGRGVARGLGTDTTGAAGVPPRRLTDVLRDLSRRNDDPHHGAVDVRIITLADGSRRVIVDITGTKCWSLGPTKDITSLTTNGRALVGDRSAYEQGVLAAMDRAGVRRTDDVMLVGHSEGGTVAVTTARDAVSSGHFRVTHVVTAGSPIGRTVGGLPSSVRVLALENSQDLVPHLDGEANPDRRNVTTVSGTRGDGRVEDDHSLDHAYIPIAGDAQASDSSSVRDFLTSADGYFRGTGVTTHTYQIIRRP